MKSNIQKIFVSIFATMTLVLTFTANTRTTFSGLFTKENVVTISRLFENFNWSNFCIQLILIGSILYLYQENRNLKKIAAAINHEISDEIYLTIEKQRYKCQCLLLEKQFNVEDQKKHIEEYLKLNRPSLTIVEVTLLVEKHCPIFPLTC
jgi:hypothetical protein